MKTYIDLHLHSTASDGTLSPSEIVAHSASVIKKTSSPVVIALTDHDTVSGIPSFLETAGKYGELLKAIGGVEISSDYHGTEIHILGYGIDPKNEKLLSRLEMFRKSRDERNTRIIEKLQLAGMDISLSDLPCANPGETVARPHIARALLKKNYVSSVKEAFELYLGEGKPCFVPRILPDFKEAVSLIQESGGIAVLAHLMLYKSLNAAQKSALVAELKEAGLTGIETYYSTYTPVEEAYVESLAKKYGLILTGGTDFHGQTKPEISLFSGKGNLEIPDWILPEFFAALN